jgi:hypothetical protein
MLLGSVQLEKPNILKFKQIMSAYQKQNLEKLCKFIRNINKSLFSRLSHAHVFVVYTVYMRLFTVGGD